MQSGQCRECGATIPSDSSGGFCGPCLFGLGLKVEVAKSGLVAGTQLRDFGDYEVLEEIARGGMGIVFRARQTSLNRTVALKLITAGHLATAAAVRRFQLEAEAAARLDHPNIVPIYEIGEHEGHHYFSMKLVEGVSLAARVATGPTAWPGVGGDSPRETATLIAKVARAIHYAHQRGILHRDLKPGNILLDERGEPYVTDFGLAKLIEHDSNLTHSGMVMGTPSYMSPEQAGGKNTELTTATDLWSLGAILYELLTGQCAFRGATPVETLRQVMEQEPRKPSALKSAVDRDLETITLKCLEKDPAARYASAAALADDLEHWLRHEPIIARRSGMLERAVKWAQRQPLLASAVILLHLVLVLGVAGILWQWRQAVLARRAETAERQRAERAESGALNRLHEAKLNFIRANRLTGRLGQRFDSLAELARAAMLTNSLELRNEAIACLAIPDLRLQKQWPKTPGWDSFRFSASHRRYMTNDASGTLTIRDTETDAIIFEMPGQGAKDVATFMVSSPDDRFVASLDRTSQVRLWDGSTRPPLVVDLPRGASLLTFTPDSRALVVKHADGSLHFLNSTNGLEEKSFPGPVNLNSIRFDSVGAKFLSIVPDQIIIRQTSDGKLLRTITRPPGGVGSFQHAAWHPDGRRLVASWRNNIGFWDSETGREPAVIKGHDGPIIGLTFLRNGEYLAFCNFDHITRFWHTETYHEVLSLPESGRGFSISADDRRLSLAPWGRNQVKLYELADVKVEHRVELPAPRSRPEHTTIRALFSPNGDLVAACGPAGIWVFHHSSPAALELPVTGTLTACFTPDGEAVFTGGPDGVQKWPLKWSMDRSELHLGPPEMLAPTRGLNVEIVELSNDGQWLLAIARQKKRTVVNLQIAPPFEVVQMDKSLSACFHVDTSPDGRWIAGVGASPDALQIWNGRTGALLTNIPSRGAWQCAFSRDGKSLACGQEDSTTIWNATNWSLRRRVPHHPHDGRNGVTFSPDGRTLAVFNSNLQKMQLVKPETGEEFASFPAGLITTSMRFSPMGDRLVVSNERGYVQLRDLRHLREQLALLHLDWDMPPYPPARTSLRSGPVRLIVHTNTPGR